MPSTPITNFHGARDFRPVFRLGKKDALCRLGPFHTTRKRHKSQKCRGGAPPNSQSAHSELLSAPPESLRIVPRESHAHNRVDQLRKRVLFARGGRASHAPEVTLKLSTAGTLRKRASSRAKLAPHLHKSKPLCLYFLPRASAHIQRSSSLLHTTSGPYGADSTQ